MVPFVDLFACLCGVGMIESMLEPHLRESGASTLTIGLSFLGFGCCYSVGNMVFGRVRIEIDRLIFLVREIIIQLYKMFFDYEKSILGN